MTQHAYTLKLRSLYEQRSTNDEKTIVLKAKDAKHLWQTHLLINRGAQVFGDWLLTMRGGLSPSLADELIMEGKGTNKRNREPTEQEKADRHILLALSWLSVESYEGAPDKYVIASAVDDKDKRSKALITALEKVLKRQKITTNDINIWRRDCEDVFSSAIRDDAVWVNRADAFNDLSAEINWDYNDASSLLFHFIKQKDYFNLESKDNDKNNTIKDKESFGQVARGWLSANWGKGKKSDFSEIINKLQKIVNYDFNSLYKKSGYKIISVITQHLTTKKDSDNKETFKKLCKYIGWQGRSSKGRLALEKLYNKKSVTKKDIVYLNEKLQQEIKEKKSKNRVIPKWVAKIQKYLEEKINIKYQPLDMSRNLIGEFGVMFDHALRHVSVAHSWIKNAEINRRRFHEDAQKIDNVTKDAKEWLNEYTHEKQEFTGALGKYIINPRAIDGWKDILKGWKGCSNYEERVEVINTIQTNKNDADKHFGDANLFKRLAKDDTRAVWINNDNKFDETILKNYVDAKKASYDMQRFKVPAYRHPHPLLHPVYCDYGNSRLNVKYDAFDIINYVLNNKKIKGAEKVINKLSISLWDGTSFQNIPFFWGGKRFKTDLALDNINNLYSSNKHLSLKNSIETTKADRFGRSLVTADSIRLEIYNKGEWNARLQVDRRLLENINKKLKASNINCYSDIFSIKTSNAMKIQQLVYKLPWFLTTSPELQSAHTLKLGPWADYINSCKDKSPFLRNNKISYIGWPHYNKNKKRNKKGSMILSHLPNLRVLSVDLGHRYGATCVVWETISNKDIINLCKKHNVNQPKVDTIYHVIKTDKKIKIHFRRIAGNTLPDGLPHPASWARLERQFMIKLQGEDRSSRKIFNNEKQIAKQVAEFCGNLHDEKAFFNNNKNIEQLMSATVSILLDGIRRHNDIAKIAYYLSPERGRNPGDESLKKGLENALQLWHQLWNSKHYKHEFAKETWDKYIISFFSNKERQELTSIGDNKNKTCRKKQKAIFKNIAQKLSADDRMMMYKAWDNYWHERDGHGDKGKTKLCRQCIRLVRDWIMPRRDSDYVFSKQFRNVGGLSLTRINTFKKLYRVIKAYAGRPEPENIKINIAEKGDTSSKGMGDRILKAMENMRDTRIKQLASRIVEAALGLGKEQGKKDKNTKDISRPRENIFKPCHALIIENLKNYRPDELQTRRENRQLMTWSSHRIFDFLKDECDLFGIHLRTVSPSYTSRQDSRTGAPGIRCTDIPLTNFLKENSYWQQQVKKADEKKLKDDYSSFIVNAYSILIKKYGHTPPKDKWIRLPRRGGEIFVTADNNSPIAKGIHADINAAANIGLRALLDPDWAGSWWYVPCNKDGTPKSTEIKGSTIFKEINKLPLQGDIGGKGDIVNLWSDVSSSNLENKVWKYSTNYKSNVRKRVIERLMQQSILKKDQND